MQHNKTTTFKRMLTLAKLKIK